MPILKGVPYTLRRKRDLCLNRIAVFRLRETANTFLRRTYTQGNYPMWALVLSNSPSISMNNGAVIAHGRPSINSE
jgi:hypothetical protein